MKILRPWRVRFNWTPLEVQIYQEFLGTGVPFTQVVHELVLLLQEAEMQTGQEIKAPVPGEILHG